MFCLLLLMEQRGLKSYSSWKSAFICFLSFFTCQTFKLVVSDVEWESPTQIFMGQGLSRSRDPLWISGRQTTMERHPKRKAGWKSALESDVGFFAHPVAIKTQTCLAAWKWTGAIPHSFYIFPLAQLVRRHKILVCTGSFISFHPCFHCHLSVCFPPHLDTTQILPCNPRPSATSHPKPNQSKISPSIVSPSRAKLQYQHWHM